MLANLQVNNFFLNPSESCGSKAAKQSLKRYLSTCSPRTDSAGHSEELGQNHERIAKGLVWASQRTQTMFTEHITQSVLGATIYKSSRPLLGSSRNLLWASPKGQVSPQTASFVIPGSVLGERRAVRAGKVCKTKGCSDPSSLSPWNKSRHCLGERQKPRFP